MRYRPYKPEDFATLYSIEEVCFSPPDRFSRAYMRQLIAQTAAGTWIAESDDGMCGFGIVEWSREGAGVVAYVQTLEVLPNVRGKGVGRELLGHLEAVAKAAGAHVIWLHVDAHNFSAIRVYECAGYRQTGTHDHYYGRGRVALVFEKHLPLAPQR